MEPYLDEAGLVRRTAWLEYVRGLRESAEHKGGSAVAALQDEWLQSFRIAVLERASACKGPIGVFFSGGLDSTLIAFILASHRVEFTCYVAGFHETGLQEPEDLVEARKTASHFGWTLKESVVDMRGAEQAIKQARDILADPNPVAVGVASVIIIAAECAKKDGCTEFFCGLGSEDTFAGYARHEAVEDVNNLCWHDLETTYDRDLVRDFALGSALGIHVHTPFHEPLAVQLAMRMPGERKIQHGHRKYLLREIALRAGLPGRFAFRGRKAAQYGSRMDGALGRLAKRKGVKKSEYLQGKKGE